MNEKTTWDVLMAEYGNPYGAAGLMGNLYAESALNPINLQNSYEKKLGYTDEAYTAAVDNGSYDGFVNDHAGYGLAQWTHPSRKEKLLAYARSRGESIGSGPMQLAFLLEEMKDFPSVVRVLTCATSVREASDAVLIDYERPANQSESNKERRAALGQRFFDKYAGAKEGEPMNDKAQKTVDVARSQLGGPYVFGAWGNKCTPNLRRRYADYNPEHEANIRKGCQVLNGSSSSCEGCKWNERLAFDCRGFTHWVLAQADINIVGGGATSQYNTASNWARRGTIDQMPDLPCCVFKRGSDGKTMMHTGYHIGGGQIIHCSVGVQEGSINEPGWTHYAVPAGLYTEDELAAARRVERVETLRKGSTGNAVREVQDTLATLGYDAGTVDGVYGTKTIAAVKKFQADKGLTVDGVCGPATLAALREALENQNPDKPVEEPTEEQPQSARNELVEQIRACHGRIQKEMAQMAVLIEALNKTQGGKDDVGS